MFCRTCSKTVPDQAVVCVGCGCPPGAGRAFCSSCGGPTQPAQAICLKCGVPLGTGGTAGAGQKPGKVQAIAIMTLVGGIVAGLCSLTMMLVSVFLWIPWIYGVVIAIMALVRGISLLGDSAPQVKAPKGIAIMQICNAVNCDWINVVLGIITLVFLTDPQVQAYFGTQSAVPPGGGPPATPSAPPVTQPPTA